MSLALRSLFWTLLLPGFFAGFLPWAYFGVADVDIDWSSPRHLAGLMLIALGAVLLIACIVDFARRGSGTLSPADPPKELVVQGLYRYVRNPMYLSVITIIVGEVLLTWSPYLLLYAVIWFGCATIFVRWYEEPTLRRQFGTSYDRYAGRVGRWVPSFSSPKTRGHGQ